MWSKYIDYLQNVLLLQLHMFLYKLAQMKINKQIGNGESRALRARMWRMAKSTLLHKPVPSMSPVASVYCKGVSVTLPEQTHEDFLSLLTLKWLKIKSGFIF